MTLPFTTIATTGSETLVEDARSSPPAPVPPDREAVVARSVASDIEEWGYDRYGRWHRRQPLHVLRAIAATPPGQSALWTLKSTVLAGGFDFLPASRPGEEGTADPLTAEAMLLLEQCKRAQDRMETPLEPWAWEMLDAVAERVKLAEHVMEAVPDGPDRGLWTLKALKVKPREFWRFAVDDAMNVPAISAYTDRDRWEYLDARHFTWLSWDPREGDPRGRSCLDAAFHAFNTLNQIWPEAFQGWQKFGFPSVFFTTGEAEVGDVPLKDRDGNLTGRTQSPETRLALAGAQMRSGATVAARYGAQAKVIESTRDGSMIEQAIKVLEAQIIVCILMQTRAIREAEFGSKADAENGTGVVGTFAQYLRSWLCAAARRPFLAMCEANHDREIARRSTPHISLGRIDPRNFSAICQAIGVLYQSGYFTEEQMVWLDGFMGLPPRRPGERRVGPQVDAMAAPSKAVEAISATVGEIHSYLQSCGMPAGRAA